MQEQRNISHYSEVLKLNKINAKCFFDLYKKLIPLFKKINLQNNHIILAVSWWADSMLMSCLILQYFKEYNIPLNYIHIAHCNHKIRLESEHEAKFMSEFFSGLDFHLFERISKSWEKDEDSLRMRRYYELSSLQKSSKASYVFLGHHLNDRVESSILHMIRWANITGFLNMHQIQKHPLLPQHSEVCRPLLNTPKSEILNVCNLIWLPYFEDKTNQDCSISKRNRIRHNIIEPLSIFWSDNWKENHFLESFSAVYANMEDYESSTKINVPQNELLQEIPCHPLRHAESAYKVQISTFNINKWILLNLFEILWLKHSISSNIVNERLDRIHNEKNGNKFFHWTNFFIHERELYIIKAERNFRIRKNNHEENIKIDIKSINNVNFLWFNLDIPRSELIGGIIRLPQPWDTFAWKSWHRRALNQKIPMWRRDRIPLAIKNGKVIHMWKYVWKNFNQ